jgi:hypothetical protein
MTPGQFDTALHALGISTGGTVHVSGPGLATCIGKLTAQHNGVGGTVIIAVSRGSGTHNHLVAIDIASIARVEG